MEWWLASLVILLSSLIIFVIGPRFARASSRIGDYLKMPRDVKGATFDAVASSLPELFVALFSVIIYQQFEIGVGTIAGSALFNLLVIPGLCVLVAPVAFKVSKKVISRDALYYLLSVFVLIVLVIYYPTWGLFVALFLLLLYVMYLKDILAHTLKHPNKNNRKIHIKRELLIFFLGILVIGVSTFFLTEASIELSEALNVPAVIIAFTIVAAATSFPDMVISVANARRGNVDDATSNVFGSNVFDIFVGLGLPLLIYYLYQGAVTITFTNLEIILGLLGSTILILFFFADNRTLSKGQAKVLLLMYVLFVVYTVSLGI